MKLLKTILAMLVFLPVMGLAANLQEGLVAHYKFDGDAKDASGNGHDLVNNGATLTVDRFGNNNGAYHFDGQSFLRSIQDEDLILTTNSGAVSGWFKAEKNISTFYSESTSGTCYAAPYAFAPPCGDNNVGTAGVGFAVGANGVMVYEHAGNYLPTPLVYKGDLGNEWNHICVTLKDNGAEQLYINGKFVKGGVKSYKTKFIGIPCVDGIGGCRYGYFTGAIDDVRVYSRALSDEEVMALYQEETARWKVGFDAVGGVASTNEITVIDRMPVSVLPTVEDWDGHNFLGWFTAAEGGERVTSETVITSNVTFYAHWRDLSKEMLIAHYKFDGDAKDASGNGYDLNGDVAMWGAGRYGDLNGAAWFSGSGYYTPETWFNVQNSMTISVWVKPDKDITLYNEGQACSTDNNGVIIYPSHGGASGTIAGLGVFVGKMVLW